MFSSIFVVEPFSNFLSFVPYYFTVLCHVVSSQARWLDGSLSVVTSGLYGHGLEDLCFTTMASEPHRHLGQYCERAVYPIFSVLV